MFGIDGGGLEAPSCSCSVICFVIQVLLGVVDDNSLLLVPPGTREYMFRLQNTAAVCSSYLFCLT